jgi:hypothetical protein
MKLISISLISFLWWFAIHHNMTYSDSFTTIGPFASEADCKAVVEWAKNEGAQTSKCWNDGK